MTTTAQKGYAGTIAALLITGALWGLWPSDNSYVCSSGDPSVYICDKLSSTGKTCYWTIDSVQKSKACSVKFIKLKDYIPDKPECLTNQWVCNENNCTAKCIP